MRTLRVPLGDRTYPIWIGAGLIDQAGTRLKRLSRIGQIAVVSNRRVMRLYGPRVSRSLKRAGIQPRVILLPDGERYKTLRSVEKILDALVSWKFERGSLLVALGGGVIGDITGFAASAYLRGIDHVQIPTTVVAQVDSSVGGKTGVDHPRGKNLIGAFWQPKGVLIDPAVLGSLPKRQFVAGLAEVIKYGVIADRAFFQFLERRREDILRRDGKAMGRVIADSCRIKARVVGSDEREISGRRMILNFGHTFGHALETATGYSKYLHGEAVAIGMVFAARLAVRRGLLGAREGDRIVALIKAFGLPADAPKEVLPRYVEIMRRDKKVKEGKLRFVVPSRIGRVRVIEVDPPELYALAR